MFGNAQTHVGIYVFELPGGRLLLLSPPDSSLVISLCVDTNNVGLAVVNDVGGVTVLKSKGHVVIGLQMNMIWNYELGGIDGRCFFETRLIYIHPADATSQGLSIN